MFCNRLNGKCQFEEKPKSVEAFFPMTSEQAKEIQRNAAKSLGVPLEKQVDLGTGVDLKIIFIPPGEFMIGSPEDEEGRDDKEFQHKVKLTKAFYMGIYEVTQAQYRIVMGTNPSHFEGRDNKPVENVIWDDAVEFCKKLSQKKNRTYRLPTEAEWEYACRAGTTTPFYFGATISTNQSNYDGNYTYANGRKGTYRRRTTEVGSFPPNAFGLYDMAGNVYEWCNDWYDIDYYSKNQGVDPQGPTSGKYRVIRGGGWLNSALSCRSADRYRSAPDGRYRNNGFRIVLSVSSQDFQ